MLLLLLLLRQLRRWRWRWWRRRRRRWQRPNPGALLLLLLQRGLRQRYLPRLLLSYLLRPCLPLLLLTDLPYPFPCCPSPSSSVSPSRRNNGTPDPRGRTVTDAVALELLARSHHWGLLPLSRRGGRDAVRRRRRRRSGDRHDRELSLELLQGLHPRRKHVRPRQRRRGGRLLLLARWRGRDSCRRRRGCSLLPLGRKARLEVVQRQLPHRGERRLLAAEFRAVMREGQCMLCQGCAESVTTTKHDHHHYRQQTTTPDTTTTPPTRETTTRAVTTAQDT